MKTPVKITLERLINKDFSASVMRLADIKKIGIKRSYQVVAQMKKIIEAQETYENRLKALQEAHAERDDKGDMVFTDDKRSFIKIKDIAEYQKEYGELIGIEYEFEFDLIDLEALETDDARFNLSSNDVNNLEGVFIKPVV